MGDTGVVTPLAATQNGIGCFFYFLQQTPAGSPAEVQVTVNITGSDGSSYVENAYVWVNVYKPSGITITAEPGTIEYTDTDGKGCLEVGDANLGIGDGQPGMTMSANGISHIFGNFAWLQILNRYVTQIGVVPHAFLVFSPASDGGFPYPNSGQSYTDNPDVISGDVAGGPAALSVEISATGYLMWNSGVTGAIWVPLVSEDWYALAQEEGGVVTGTEPVASNFQDNIVDPPTWEETFTTASDGG